jgi:hypothetical protein
MYIENTLKGTTHMTTSRILFLLAPLLFIVIGLVNLGTYANYHHPAALGASLTCFIGAGVISIGYLILRKKRRL